ncbi:MAG: hypothetical protein ACRED9_10855 [Caulobacteraceae bacterium]
MIARPYTFSQVHIDDLRRAYEATGNPVFAWFAIDWCLNEHPFTPIPDWCLAVLADAARNIIRLSGGNDFRPTKRRPAALSENLDVSDPVDKSGAAKVEWAKWVALVPAAMGFTSKGKNRFRDAQAAWVKMRAARNYEQQRGLLGKQSKEAEAVVIAQLGLADSGADGSAARAIIREGQRVSHGRRPKPRG